MNEKIVLSILFVLGIAALVYGLNRESLESVVGEDKTYSISCETPKGWVEYKTHRKPFEASWRRGGVWYFETLEGKNITSTKCHSEE